MPDTSPSSTAISVRALRESDLEAADRVMRLAFSTFLGLPDPMAFMEDGDYVRTRWAADPGAAFVAEAAGEVVGSNFATHWGSFGYFGPLSVHPRLWDRGVASRLMEPIVDLLDGWKLRHAGLFTFPHSQKHIGLYQKFGFRPRFLTPIMSKPVDPREVVAPFSRFSELSPSQKSECLEACRRLTDSIYEGLDIRAEIREVERQGLGDTVLLWEGSRLAGFAVCHYGAGSEAGSRKCFVKFGAASPEGEPEESFDRLLIACEALAASEKAPRLEAGVNMAREEAYRLMHARGFRTDLMGVAMHKPNDPAYNRPGVFVIDDWR